MCGDDDEIPLSPMLSLCFVFVVKRQKIGLYPSLKKEYQWGQRNDRVNVFPSGRAAKQNFFLVMMTFCCFLIVYI